MRIIDIVKKLFGGKFIRYCFCGGIAAIVDISTFFMLNEILKFHYFISLSISFPLAALVNYLLQRKITFKGKGRNFKLQFVVFVTIALIGWAFNASITAVQVEFFGVWPTAARVIATILVTFFTYNSNKLITFGKIVKEDKFNN
ncbi:MAG: GtrA family protein [archaeon]|jgi:putative flippase GtrA